MGARPTPGENFHVVIPALRENYLRSAIVEDVEELVRKYRTLLLPYKSLPWTPRTRDILAILL